MSAIIAPPRPTERAAAGTPSPAPHADGHRSSRPGHPALRLVAGSAPAAQTARAAGSTAGSHLRLVRDSTSAQQPASDRRRPWPAGPSSAIAHTTGALSPARSSSPVPSSTTVSPSPAGPAGEAGRGPSLPSLPAEMSRRPGFPPSLRPEVRSSASGGADNGAGRHATGAQASPGSASSRAGRIDEMERLAPRHPAVRAARSRARQVGAASASGPSARAGRAQRTERRDAALMSLPVQVRRFVAALGACMVAIVLVAGAVAASGLLAPQATQTTTAVVQPGQSLWEIASATGTTDVSRTMDTIVELNGLEGPTLHAGQQLTVPVH